MKLNKYLLIVTLASAVIGWGNLGPWLLNAVARPISAIFFGLFMIFTMLENEVAKYDAERAECLRKIGPQPEPQTARPTHEPVGQLNCAA
jgi:hypothetical protein